MGGIALLILIGVCMCFVLSYDFHTHVCMLAPPTTCLGAMISNPEGVSECSHGWSVTIGRYHRSIVHAKPVVRLYIESVFAPEGRRRFPCLHHITDIVNNICNVFGRSDSPHNTSAASPGRVFVCESPVPRVPRWRVAAAPRPCQRSTRGYIPSPLRDGERER